MATLSAPASPKARNNMTAQSQRKTMNRRKSTLKWWHVLGILVLAGGAAGGIYWWRSQAGSAAVTGGKAVSSQSGYQTTTARMASLSTSASGTGTLVTTRSVTLGFDSKNTIAEIDVQPGDQVQTGAQLAVLDGLAAMKLDVSNNELALQDAQKTLDTLKTGGVATIAQAQADLDSAQKAVDDAQANLRQKGVPRCYPSQTQSYFDKYFAAKKRADPWEAELANPNSKYGRDFILEQLAPLVKARDSNYISWVYCLGYTDAEVQQSQANLQLAQAKLGEAQKTYQAAQANGGIDPVQLKIAEAAVANAQLQLTKSQQTLNSAVLLAPFAGTITAVNGSVGQAASGNVLTLSDLSNLQIQVNMDESDLESFQVGCPATITFTGLSSQTFTGEVTQITPVLVSVRNVDMAQIMVDFNRGTLMQTKTYLGLQANVEVTCNSSGNVLVIPTQALHRASDGATYVYVLNGNTPEKRTVETGESTTALVEIRSGLSEGERVVLTAANLP
jgi:HlyD family secretion protein